MVGIPTTPSFMTITYRQKTKYDCGIRALSFILQIDYDELKYIWGWENYNDFRDNLKDSPYHHFSLLDKLHTKYKRVTIDDILSGNYTSNKTMCLIHFDKNPYLYQHWIVLTKSSAENDEFIYAHYGDVTIRKFLPSDFTKLFNYGWPQCAYIVGEGESITPWYQKLYSVLIDIFI